MAMEINYQKPPLHHEIQDYERESSGPVVVYEGTLLNRNMLNKVFLLSHSGKERPEAKLEFSGFQGQPFTIEMGHVLNKHYGGHRHRIEPKYLGEFRCDPPGLLVPDPHLGSVSMVLPPWIREFTIYYKASDVCARRRLKIISQALKMSLDLVVDVKYAVGLYKLQDESYNYLEPYTGDEVHPKEVSHYGTRGMIAALLAIDRAFGEAVKNGDLPADTPIIRVNDISLPWGGSFRLYGKMEKMNEAGKVVSNDHQTHKWGTDVDISYNAMTSKQRSWFRKEASKHFSTVDTHAKGKDYEHWHLDL